ncbi:MAG: hypothetical protein Hens3KO_07410 [Henriciella sp.]
MSPLKIIFAALALSFSATAVTAPIASAQGTNIIVIDQARIMRDSAAGKDIQTKLQAIGTSMEQELNPTATALSTEGQALEGKTANMTQQQILANEALKTEVTNYARKAQEFNIKRQIAGQELSLTERKAWADFFEQLRPILQEVVTERGAQIIMERSELTYADPAIDASDLVISKMNSRVPTISVVRQKLPTQPAQ